MKRIIGIIFCVICVYSLTISAAEQRIDGGVYDLNGDMQRTARLYLHDLKTIAGEEKNLAYSENIPEHVNFDSEILASANEGDLVLVWDMRTDDIKDPYPEIEPARAVAELPQPGGVAVFFGEKYRLFFMGQEDQHLTNISENILSSSYTGVSFTADKLGVYVIYAEPMLYTVTFYNDVPKRNDDGSEIDPEVYFTTDRMDRNDIIDFPPIPEKQGYVFCGWKVRMGSGIFFCDPQPLFPGYNLEYFAAWCEADKYEPIEITLTSKEPLVKGREDGQKLLLKTNYGIFREEEFPAEWRKDYDAAENEEQKAEILAWWKSQWNIKGSDELLVEKVERLDEKTLELTLSGNSGSVYGDLQIQVEFNHELLSPEPYTDENGNSITYDDTKIQMDEDGVRAQMYQTEPFMISGQTRSTGGGAGGGGTIAAPKASLQSGEVAAGTKLELTSGYNNAQIYYTTDGTTPSEKSTLYTEPITIDKDMTVKYLAVVNGRSGKAESRTFTVIKPTIEIKANAERIRYITGRSGKEFCPDEAITRYEMLSALNSLVEISNAAASAPFSDVPKEYEKLVGSFAGAGIIEGYEDGSFRGDGGLSRAEFVKVMAIVLDVKPAYKDAAFSDTAGHWAKEYIADFARLGYLKGYEDGTFRPDEQITRAEFTAVINRIVKNSNAPLGNIFTDVPDTHWAKDDILKAYYTQ